jgi:hypothetical protein
MKTLLNPWFILGCITWVIIYSSRKLGHPVPLLNGYIDDFFAIPVIANIVLSYMRVMIIKSDYYVLSAWKVVFIVLYVSLMFEVLLPLYSKKYTGDWIDAVLYAIGGVFFYFVMNKPVASRKS